MEARIDAGIVCLHVESLRDIGYSLFIVLVDADVVCAEHVDFGPQLLDLRVGTTRRNNSLHLYKYFFFSELQERKKENENGNKKSKGNRKKRKRKNSP